MGIINTCPYLVQLMEHIYRETVFVETYGGDVMAGL